MLIVHGRGLNSKDQVPVLKTRLAQWLARGSWARLVLAFTSARPCDGGAGALYVLLRRQRHTGPRAPVKVSTARSGNARISRIRGQLGVRSFTAGSDRMRKPIRPLTVNGLPQEPRSSWRARFIAASRMAALLVRRPT